MSILKLIGIAIAVMIGLTVLFLIVGAIWGNEATESLGSILGSLFQIGIVIALIGLAVRPFRKKERQLNP